MAGESLPTPHTRNVTREYWVDAAVGSDATSEAVARDSAANPWQTIANAISNCLIPTSGDCAINVRPTGTYQETGAPQATAIMEKAGLTSAKRLILRKDPAAGTKPLIRMKAGTAIAQHDCVQMKSAFTIIDGFELDSSGRPGLTSGAGTDGTGVYVPEIAGTAAGDIEIWNLDIHALLLAAYSSNKVQGVFCEPSAPTDPILCYNLKVWDIGPTAESESEQNLEHGYYLHGNVWLINCLTYDIWNGFGVQIYDGGAVVDKIYLIHNTIALTTDMALITVDPRNSTNIEFRNSIFYAAPSGNPNISNTQGTAPGNGLTRIIDHCINKVVAGTVPISNAADFTITFHDTSSDPLFTDEGGRDFHPASDSTAVGYVDDAYSPSFDLEEQTRVGEAVCGALNFPEVPTPPNTQVRSPATVVMGDEGQRDYTNPDNVKVSDNAYATGSYFNLEQMEKLTCSGFPFTIPTGATINSIVVHIEQFVSTGSGVNNWQVQVDKGAVPGLGGFTAGTPTETVIDVIEFPLGGSDPLWGNTWTAEEINDDLVVIVFTDHDLDDSADVSIDHISVTVEYTPSGEPPPNSIRTRSRRMVGR